MSGKSRIEKILENLLGGDNVIEPPIGRDEKILYSILNDTEYTEPPHSIFEDFLLAIKNGSATETTYMYEYLTRDEKILFCKLNRLEYFEPPHSRLEKLLIKWLYLDLYLNIDGVPPFTFISNGSPLIDYLISGNTVQTGTPTPDSPIMPQGTGERTGNLVNLGSWSNQYFTDTRTFFSARFRVSGDNYKQINVKSTGTYKLTLDNLTNETVEFLHNGSARNILIFSYTANFAEPTNLTVSFTASGYDPTTINGINLSDIMLNSGSTALPFEPYGYKIQILSAGTTTPVYLGEVETTRKIKKLVIDGTENWVSDGGFFHTHVNSLDFRNTTNGLICSHLPVILRDDFNRQPSAFWGRARAGDMCLCISNAITTLDAFKSYLSAQYAAGTPVTVWYVLATEETAVVNEPLMKIGDYADSISYEQTVVSIPTVSGRNTFDVLGDVKPSNVEITYVPRAPLLGKRKTILKK